MSPCEHLLDDAMTQNIAFRFLEKLSGISVETSLLANGWVRLNVDGKTYWQHKDYTAGAIVRLQNALGIHLLEKGWL